MLIVQIILMGGIRKTGKCDYEYATTYQVPLFFEKTK
jgi:hypothetical protein